MFALHSLKLANAQVSDGTFFATGTRIPIAIGINSSKSVQYIIKKICTVLNPNQIPKIAIPCAFALLSSFGTIVYFYIKVGN